MSNFMKREKVYLRIETPLSVKGPITRQLILRLGFTVIAVPALLLWLYNGTPENRELADTLIRFFALIAVFGYFPIVMMYFNSYAMVVDEDLICNQIGFWKKRYPRQVITKAVRTTSQIRPHMQIEIYAGSKRIVVLPDNDAAKRLVEQLHLLLQ